MSYREQAEKQEELEERIELANDKLSKIEKHLNRAELIIKQSFSDELDVIDNALRYYYKSLSPSGVVLYQEDAALMIRTLTVRKDALTSKIKELK